MAMTVDGEDQTLLTGDTAGFIAVFDITNFCHTPTHVREVLAPIGYAALNHAVFGTCRMTSSRTHLQGGEPILGKC